MAHLLVTGGAGYVGGHALHALARAGHSVVAIDDLRSGCSAQAGDAPLLRRDIGDAAELERVFARYGPFDGVLHFAASPGAAPSVARPLRSYREDLVASATLVDTSLRHGVQAFVFASSAAVYGHAEFQPVPESAPLDPVTPHGAAKAMVERLLADVEDAHGMRWAALRGFNAAGADLEAGLGECHDPEIHLIPRALAAAVGLGPEIPLYGSDYDTRDGTGVRDYVHVSDLADAHVLALEALLAGGPGGSFNVGTGRGYSVREVLAAVGTTLDLTVPWRETGRRDGDPPELVADTTRLRRELGWEPRRSALPEIVSSAFAWLQQRRGDEISVAARPADLLEELAD